jgi:hypothetical protein
MEGVETGDVGAAAGAAGATTAGAAVVVVVVVVVAAGAAVCALANVADRASAQRDRGYSFLFIRYGLGSVRLVRSAIVVQIAPGTG